MFIHLGFWTRYLSKPSFVTLVLSAVFLAAAMMSWDMIQYYLIIWILGYGVLQLVLRRPEQPYIPANVWAVHAGLLLLAGLLNPYMRSHAFPLSLGMLLLYGVFIVNVLLPRWTALSKGRWKLILLLVTPLILGWCFGQAYSVGYGHFGELLLAKIRFLNHKPVDPALLTYAQRIMWVPALHSADWQLTRQLFPTTVYGSLFGVGLILFSRFFKPDFSGVHFLIFYAVSLILFIFFVRFHVFLIPFSAFFIVAPVASVRQRSGLASAIMSILVLGVISAEATHTLGETWGRKNVYYHELNGLTQFLDEQVAPEPVLANFGVSASILAYGRCPIVLHPKFETAEIRQRVQEYANVLFKGTESDFRDWADQSQAQYYVHSFGGYASIHQEYQMRYFVDALNPESDTTAWLFEHHADQLRYFQSVYSNRKYQVFKIVTHDMEARAIALAVEAGRAEAEGRLTIAFEKAQEALALYPYESAALKIADRVSSRSP